MNTAVHFVSAYTFMIFGEEREEGKRKKRREGKGEERKLGVQARVD